MLPQLSNKVLDIGASAKVYIFFKSTKRLLGLIIFEYKQFFLLLCRYKYAE